MKTIGLSSALGLLFLSACPGNAADRLSPAAAGYRPIEADRHFTVWAKVRTNAAGVAYTNKFCELCPGLNRWTGSGWTPSTPELIATNGGVLGWGAGHAAFFAGNINTRGAVQIRMRTGEWVKAHVLGLAYLDPSGTNVFLAELKDCAPRVEGSNCVVYADAFADLSGQIRYSYRRDGVAQWVVLNERPPSPAEYGLSTNCDLVVLSELVEAPAAVLQERLVRVGREWVRDQTIGLGPMRLVEGRAFQLGSASSRAGVLISKRHEIIDNRRLIVERVSYRDVEAQLLGLPPAGSGATNAPGGTNASLSRATRWFAQGTVPVPPKSLSAGNGLKAAPKQLAATTAQRSGFVLDWDMAENASGVFSCGDTWLVSGQCHLLSAEFQAGTVLKFDYGSSLHLDGPLTYTVDPGCSEEAPILTSVNDDYFGEWIEGYSSGYPQEGDYGPALVVRPEDISIAEGFSIYYSSWPAIDANLATVTVTASDSLGAAGGSDNAVFRITRTGGDWSQQLTVYFSVGGTAVAGRDYQDTLGTSATIYANQESAEVTVVPLAGGVFETTLTLTLGANAAYTVGSPQAATVSLYDPTVPAPVPILAPPNLVGWWAGENDGNDSSGGGHHGTLLNGLGFSLGYVGRAFSFDGVDDRLRVEDAGALNFGGGTNFSLEAWVRPEPANTPYGVQAILDKRLTPYTDRAVGYTLFLQSGRLAFQMTDAPLQAGKYGNFGPVGPDVRDGHFHHVAVTVDRDSPTGLKFYVDGVLQGAGYDPRAMPGDLSNTEPLWIGKHAALSADFKGILDEVSLYDRSLTATEIQAIHSAGRGGKSPDIDADGLPDRWEMRYFGNLDQTADGDPDGDGVTNLAEYLAGTNPLVPDAGHSGDFIAITVLSPVSHSLLP